MVPSDVMRMPAAASLARTSSITLGLHACGLTKTSAICVPLASSSSSAESRFVIAAKSALSVGAALASTGLASALPAPKTPEAPSATAPSAAPVPARR